MDTNDMDSNKDVLKYVCGQKIVISFLSSISFPWILSPKNEQNTIRVPDVMVTVAEHWHSGESPSRSLSLSLSDSQAPRAQSRALSRRFRLLINLYYTHTGTHFKVLLQSVWTVEMMMSFTVFYLFISKSSCNMQKQNKENRVLLNTWTQHGVRLALCERCPLRQLDQDS